MLIGKLKTVIALLAIIFVSMAFRGAAPGNFAGTWTLNEGKSELGQFGASGTPGKIVIEQKEQNIIITSTGMAPDGSEMTTTDNYTDGKESETILGPMKKKGTLKWSDDQQAFTVSFTINIDAGGQSMEMKGSELWTLSDEGKSLAAAITLQTPRGNISMKAVYNRQ